MVHAQGQHGGDAPASIGHSQQQLAVQPAFETAQHRHPQGSQTGGQLLQVDRLGHLGAVRATDNNAGSAKWSSSLTANSR